jgi:flavin reductase (DIM6/NTAB) family NADH-FMN oxidoreductase RutF
MTELADRFRSAIGSLAGGVCVVTCRVGSDDHAMTATALTSVSMHPPLMLVCVSRTARFWEAMSATEHWAVSMLTADASDHATWLAKKGRPLAGQLEQVPHRRSVNGVALLQQSCAWVECETDSQVRAGDHDIFIGAVTDAVKGPGDSPLVYWRSAYKAASALRSDSPGERYS